jgi:maltose O-acetyltransferase
MALKSLNRLRRVRGLLAEIRSFWLRRVLGIDVHPTASLSFSSELRPYRRGSISVGADTLVAFKTLIYTRDEFGLDRPVKIGQRCFIGGGSIVLPGVNIGDECIVGAGAVVMSDIPSRSIVGGNPARVLRSNIKVGRFGRLEGADENSRRMWV